MFMWFWIFVGMFAAAFELLGALEYGLEVNNNSRKIYSDELVTPGRYWLGLGHHFKTFPRNTQILIFSTSLRAEKSSKAGAGFSEAASFFPTIKARTQEGLPVTLDVVVFYKLGVPDLEEPSIPQQLTDLYSKFELNYNDMIQRVVNFEMRNVAAEIKALEYFSRRAELGDNFRNALIAALEEYYIRVTQVSITNIGFSAAFESTIQDTEIARQEVLTAEFERDGNETQAETNIELADKNANITIETALAEAEVRYASKSGIANATSYKFERIKSAFEIVRDDLGFVQDDDGTIPQKLLTFYWIFAQRYNEVKDLKLGINQIEELARS